MIEHVELDIKLCTPPVGATKTNCLGHALHRHQIRHDFFAECLIDFIF